MFVNFQISFGAAKAKLVAQIFSADGTAVVPLSSSIGGVISADGKVTLDGNGGFSVYLDPGFSYSVLSPLSSGQTLPDRKVNFLSYKVTTAFQGAALGDLISCTQIVDLTGAPVPLATIWKNQTKGNEFLNAPDAANLTSVALSVPASSQGLPSGPASSSNNTDASSNAPDIDPLPTIGTIGATAKIIPLADINSAKIPHTLTVAPDTGCTIEIATSTNGSTYTVVSTVTAKAILEYDLEPGETWVSHIRLTRTVGTSTASTFSIRI